MGVMPECDAGEGFEIAGFGSVRALPVHDSNPRDILKIRF
jgi:hypothetical protein